MTVTRIIGLILIVAGIAALGIRGFSFTKETQQLKIGPIELSVKQKQEVDFPIPGNDDAARAIQLYVGLIADAVLDGLSESSMAAGVDPGAAETVREPALADTAAAEAQA